MGTAFLSSNNIQSPHFNYKWHLISVAFWPFEKIEAFSFSEEHKAKFNTLDLLKYWPLIWVFCSTATQIWNLKISNGKFCHNFESYDSAMIASVLPVLPFVVCRVDSQVSPSLRKTENHFHFCGREVDSFQYCENFCTIHPRRVAKFQTQKRHTIKLILLTYQDQSYGNEKQAFCERALETPFTERNTFYNSKCWFPDTSVLWRTHSGARHPSFLSHFISY